MREEVVFEGEVEVGVTGCGNVDLEGVFFEGLGPGC